MKSSNNKKAKPPKAKPKAPEVKKDLTNVRVIQRKMAYVIGLPLSLADEDVWSSFFVILSPLFPSLYLLICFLVLKLNESFEEINYLPSIS